MRRRFLRGRYIWNRVPFLNRPFCSAPQTKSNNKPATISSNGSESSSSSLSQYSEQYKALNNLDFMTAAKILFTDQSKKKKFGLDFHLVQLFFVCLPSLAVYLVAQYARSEMKKMDANIQNPIQVTCMVLSNLAFQTDLNNHNMDNPKRSIEGVLLRN